MDWSTRSLLTASFQTSNIRIQEQHQPQQFTAAGSKANASIQNSCTYSGNNQTIKILSNRMNTFTNNWGFPNPGSSRTLQPILPKTSIQNKDDQPTHHVLTIPPSSLGHVSTEMVQVAAGMTQNSSLTKNVHISSPVQGSTENPMQNIPQQTVNQPIALNSYNNRPLQNSSNSMTTSVCQQNRKNNVCQKNLPMLMHYYHVNGPVASQIDATVPLNQASSQYSNSQQNLSCLVFPLHQNTQNQINGPSSSLTATLQSQHFASDTVNPIQYGVPTPHNSKNATQTFPQDRNPPPYPVPSVQRNHGQFVLPQAVANISHENVQNYHRPMLAQSSNLYSAQHGERHPSIPFIRETNEIGNTPYSVSGHKAVNHLPNELTKSSVEVGESLCNSVQVVGTVPLGVTLTSQAGRTLEQENNLANGSRHFPENLKDEITKESLALDKKTLYELKKTLLKLNQDYKMKCKMYQSSVQNSQAADSSVHNQNPDISLPYNTNPNQFLPLPKDTNQANQVLPHDTTQSLLPTSYSSGEVKDAPLSLKTNDHLLPILRNMLKGTTDEDMLFNDYVKKGGTRHLAIRENSPNAPMLSTSEVSETPVNNTVSNIDEASRLRSNTSTMDSTQVPLTCTKNGPGYEITTRSANNQSVSWNKSTVETTGQYFTGSVQSSNQNPAASNGSSLSKKEARECIKQFQHSTSAYLGLIQQSNTSLPKLERKTVAESSENTSNSFSSASLPKATVQEAGITQKPSVTGGSFVVPEVCWEAVKKGLALWTKSLPSSLKQLGKKKDSAVSLSVSEVGVDGKTQQTLEKLPNTLTQKDQTKVTVGSNETTMSSAPSSLGKRLDVTNSNLLKGSELQVAIVTPLVMSKESNQNEVQKKSHSSLLEVTYPIIEETSVCSLQELSSVVPAADEGGRGTVCSASNTGITIKKEDLDMHEKTTKSSEENLIVKAEMNKDCLIHQVPHKDVKCYKSSSVLLEPGHTAEAVLNDPVLEISSVCTLVEGDKFYNSQIAGIFNSSLLKSSWKNDTSEEHMPLQHGEQQSGLLKSKSEKNINASEGDTILPSQDSLPDATAEKLLEELLSLEIPQSGKASNEVNVRDSEEGKSNSMPQSTPLSGEKLQQDRTPSADFGSDNEVLPVNKGSLFSSNTADETYTIAKESAPENVPCEEMKAYSEINTEAPKTVLNDQLTELLEEFPYGISYPKALKNADNNNLVSKLTEKDDQERPQSSVEAPSQIEITILTSEQMKEMFPEQSQSSCNIKENYEDDQLTTDFKYDLREENRSHSKTDQAVPYDSRNTPAETTVAKPSKHKYCCLRGWLASTMAVEPCECILSEEVASKQKVTLCPQSKTISKVKPEVAANHKPDCMLNDELKISTLHPVSTCVSLEAQGNTVLNKMFGDTKTGLQENESKVDPEIVPLSFSEKLGSQELEVPVKQEIEELPPHTASTLKSEAIEIKIQNHTCERDNFTADQAQCRSSIKDLKVVAARTLSKMETSVKQRSRERLVVRSKTDHRRRKIEMKHNTYHERYKIKRDSSETRIIKGPALSKSLKRKLAIEKKHKALVNQHNDAIKFPNISSIKMKNSPHTSTMPSPEHLNEKKRQKFDFEKNYGYKKSFGQTKINNKPSRTEHIEHNEESIRRKSLKLNLEKFAYSKQEKNAGNYRSSHLDVPPKHTSHASNIVKIPSSVKEAVLDTHNRDKRLERSISDKKTCFNRRAGRLSISLQKEQKKKYLNQVAFKRIAQKTICLTNLDSHSKPVWHVKSSSVSALPEDQKSSSSPCQQPEVEKPQMLAFKMCPEILFRKSVSEEQILDGKNRPEKNKTPITALKSKREDWLNYNSVKRRKTEECEAQVNDDIPLDTAIKLLEGMPVKDSKATFQTYKKMHLEKRSRSLDSTPLNEMS